MEIETIKVKARDPEQGEFVVINKADFDPKKHELFEERKSKAAKPDVASQADAGAGAGAATGQAGDATSAGGSTAAPAPAPAAAKKATRAKAKA